MNNLISRVVAQYGKDEEFVRAWGVPCEYTDYLDLFNVGDDNRMFDSYEIKTAGQKQFFQKYNIPVDDADFFWFVETYIDTRE